MARLSVRSISVGEVHITNILGSGIEERGNKPTSADPIREKHFFYETTLSSLVYQRFSQIVPVLKTSSVMSH